MDRYPRSCRQLELQVDQSSCDQKSGCIASPIDKIVLGRKHDIEEWLGDAYEAVCVRDEPLTLEDGMRLGMEDVIKISATRQRIHRQPS
jgi:hypothetical protein